MGALLASAVSFLVNVVVFRRNDYLRRAQIVRSLAAPMSVTMVLFRWQKPSGLSEIYAVNSVMASLVAKIGGNRGPTIACTLEGKRTREP